MKKILVGIFMVTFIIMVVFSIFSMTHGGHRQSICLASTTSGINCPHENLLYINFHADFFKNLSEAILDDALSMTTLFFLGFVFMGLKNVLKNTSSLDTQKIFKYYDPENRTEKYHSNLEKKIISWLSLHENSPSF